MNNSRNQINKVRNNERDQGTGRVNTSNTHQNTTGRNQSSNKDLNKRNQRNNRSSRFSSDNYERDFE